MKKTTKRAPKAIKTIKTTVGIPVAVGSNIRIIAGGDTASVVEVSEIGGVTLRWDSNGELEPFTAEEWAATEGRFELVPESEQESAPEQTTESTPESTSALDTSEVMQCACISTLPPSMPEPAIDASTVVDALEGDDHSTTDAPALESTPAPAAEIRKTIGTRTLRCTLTEEEIESYGMALAQFVTELEKLEAIQKDMPKQIKAVRERMRSTSDAIHNGYEDRDVEIYERDRGGATIDICRIDTDEVVDVREATKADRQVSLFDEESDD